MVPEGERWAQCIANRTFKTRVIDLVLLRLPAVVLHGHPNRRLIVDYQVLMSIISFERTCLTQTSQEPIEYFWEEGSVQGRVLDGLPAMGEADLKFTRFADRFAKLLVDSIDGDSIPIALLHHERCLRDATPPPLMSIYRLELNSSQAKRAADGTKRSGRTYEYVNVHALYEGLMQAIAQSTGRIRMPTHAGHEMAMLVALIALTGTDFTRNMPQISGKSVYGWLPDIWPTLASAYHPQTNRLLQDQADMLVACMYKLKFPRQVNQGSSHLPSVLADLTGSSMAQRTKDSLPSRERVACTVRNANWVLLYWTCQAAPEPVQPEYGFRALAGGATEYDD